MTWEYPDFKTIVRFSRNGEVGSFGCLAAFPAAVPFSAGVNCFTNCDITANSISGPAHVIILAVLDEVSKSICQTKPTTSIFARMLLCTSTGGSSFWEKFV